jgi:hypothetical protein
MKTPEWILALEKSVIRVSDEEFLRMEETIASGKRGLLQQVHETPPSGQAGSNEDEE